MKCIALGLLENDSSVKWCPPLTNSYGLFSINEVIQSQQAQLLELCRNLQVNTCDFAIHFGYYLAALKTPQGCCMIACDQELSPVQMIKIACWMFEPDVTMEMIFNNIEKYSQVYPKIEKLNNVLEETKNVLMNDIELLLQRKESLEVLRDKAEQLEIDSFKFRNRTEEMNSCWKRCTIL